MGDSAVAHFMGSRLLLIFDSWGLRPRLYAFTCFAGLFESLLRTPRALTPPFVPTKSL